MSVVTSGEGWFSREGEPCLFCGKPVRSPYAEWAAHCRVVSYDGVPDDEDPTFHVVVVCTGCCRHHSRRGLMRDMAEVARDVESREAFSRFCRQPVQPGAVRQ
jgi:hypothetical protein